MSSVAPAADALIRVVLADDTPDVRMLVRTALEMAGGFDVVGEASNGAEAVDLVEHRRPDVALVDLAMPVMDGLQAIPKIREISPGTKVVVLSGFEPDAIAADVLELGASRYVQKGRSLRELTATLREVAGRQSVTTRPAPMRAKVQADFVAEVVHELKNPLATVTGLADTMVLHWDALTDERRLEIAKAVKRQGQRAAALVDDLLSVARLDGGQLTVHLQAFDLTDLLPSIVDDTASLQIDGSHRVVADALRVEQILVNLLTNAARYGAPPVVVTVTSDADHALVRVRDHGSGVGLDDRGLLFERFSALARGKEGSNGLGLYIARSLARAMNGDVVYEPVVPGACFTLRLPLQK